MKSFSSNLRSWLDFIIEYAPSVTAFVVGILYAVNPARFGTNELLAAMLTLLAFTTLNTLKRSSQLKKIENITKENYDLVQKEFGEKAKARTFFLGDSDLLHNLSNYRLENARQIYLSGMSLRRTIRTLQPVLEKRIVAGAAIKIIVLDSTYKMLMEELYSRSAGTRTAEGWQEALKGTREDVQTIFSGLPKKARGSLEIGYLPYIPSFGMALINPKERTEDNKVCYVELYHHRSTLRNPTFMISSKDDEYWYKFFTAQYELLWESCERVEKLC